MLNYEKKKKWVDPTIALVEKEVDPEMSSTYELSERSLLQHIGSASVFWKEKVAVQW